MPMLDNQRHELFAQGLNQGLTADEAYVKAGYKRNRGNAIRMKADERIQSRVAELRERVAAKVEIKRAWVIERLVENVQRAMQASPVLDSRGRPTGDYIYQGSVANKALELLGKEIGMFIERSEVTERRYVIGSQPETTDPEEWAKQHAPTTHH